MNEVWRHRGKRSQRFLAFSVIPHHLFPFHPYTHTCFHTVRCLPFYYLFMTPDFQNVFLVDFLVMILLIPIPQTRTRPSPLLFFTYTLLIILL